jgi:glycolate oxidase iron-sulfur subunit
MISISNKTLEDCARCGSCKARCPVYEATLNEAHSPRGRLMLLKALSGGDLALSPGIIERIMSCSLCGICDLTCPVGMRPTEFIYKGRAEIKKADRKRFLLRIALKTGLKYPAFSLKAAQMFGISLIFPLKAKNLPSRPLKGEDQVIKPKKKSIGRIGLFAGCSANYIMPELGASLINMLLSLGYEVVLPKGEHCCGAPLRSLGLEDEARDFAERNLEIFGKLNVEAVVSPCPTCTLVIKEEYKSFLGEGIAKAQDAIEFLIKKASFSGDKLKRNGKKLLWHEPCHLKYGLGFEVKGILDELKIERSEEGCCGFSLSLTSKALSEEFLKKRAAALGKADAVVTACPACMLQLERGGLKTIHLLEMMEDTFVPRQESPKPAEGMLF